MTELNIACISDIHLGNKRNNARNIIKNLYAAFPDNSKTGELDIIFIAGDVFDSLFSLSDNDEQSGLLCGLPGVKFYLSLISKFEG